MAKYDYASAKRYIQMHSDIIEEASLGMAEDWSCTAEPVYFCDGVLIDLDEEGIKIAGIDGSAWATPALEIVFKDGRTILKDCYTGRASGQKPKWFTIPSLDEQISKENSLLMLLGDE